MRACKVSKESSLSLEEKYKKIDDYEVGDLLYVIREYEKAPGRYQKEVIKHVSDRLYKLGIMLM